MALIDAWKYIFLWVGAKAKEKDKKVALETAMVSHTIFEHLLAQDYSKYVQTLGQDRGDIQVLTVAEGAEPIPFTCCFHGWRYSPPAGIVQSTLNKASSSTSAPTPASPSRAEDALKEYSKTYTYAQLLDRNTLPPTVDKGKLEVIFLCVSI